MLDCVEYQYMRMYQDGQIQCKLSGYPAPNVRWFFIPSLPDGTASNKLVTISTGILSDLLIVYNLVEALISNAPLSNETS